MVTPNSFFGYGAIFPIVLENGKAKLFTGKELIRASIVQILAWEVGERFFLPEFGSRTQTLLYSPNDRTLEKLLYTFVYQAISKWEKRVQPIAFVIKERTADKIVTEITYRIKADNSVDSFIFPFYKKINT
jgi:phage baseplate assembly protein W